MSENKILQESLLDADDVLEAVGGRFIGGPENTVSFSFTSVVTDSRNVVKKSLFVPLIGEKQDGHKFCYDAVKNGASVIFVCEKEYEKNGRVYDEIVAKNKNVSVVLVKNTLHALQDLAEKYVSKFPLLVKVAITGSSGKTTTKEMIVAILKQKYNVVYTEGNLNSETGLPLSVFNIRRNNEIGVFEMGMNRKNEIKEISKVLKANFAVVTNIGTAHIGILKTVENIAREKKHIFDYVSSNGAAFVPAMDEFADFLTREVSGDVIKFGSIVPPETSGVKYIEDCGMAGTKISVDGEEILLPLAGVYNYANALAAIAVGKRFGISPYFIKQGLESLVPIPGRMETEKITSKNGKKITLIKDCYNANPDSMKNVLAFCKSLKDGKNHKGKTIYVLGDMLELGEKSKEAHENLGCIVASDNPDAAFFVGEEMKAAYSKAQDRNFTNSFYSEKSDDDAVKRIANKILEMLEDDDIVLLKASRGIQLERVEKCL